MSTLPGMNPLHNTSALFARASRNSQRVIVPINDSALRKDTLGPAFYCVHDITGVAGSDFIDLARRLDMTAQFYGIQAPPKKMADVDFGSSIESLAEYYADALRRFQPEGPFFLGGFCAGAIIALDIALKMHAFGREVALLVAIDAVPENTRPQLQPWNPKYVAQLLCNLPGWFKHGGLSKQKDSHSLLRRVANNAIAIGNVALGRKPSDKFGGGHVIDGQMDLSRYPPEQRDFINRFYNACFAYFAASYSGEIVVYEASVKPLVHLPQLRSRWRSIAPQAEFVGITGTHLSMLREPYVGELAHDLGPRIGLHKPKEISSIAPTRMI
jgi:thioesterase domain-containing protein